jgi:hypothetical protein
MKSPSFLAGSLGAVVTIAAFVCTVGIVLGAQNTEHPFPSPTTEHPFPNHEEPEKNWYCYPASARHPVDHDAHSCACLGMAEHPDPNKACLPKDAQDDGTLAPNDNNQCKAWCHKDHCTCDTQCEFT